MSLSLLAPLALGLLALIAGPILAHLIRQRPTSRQPFGAMLLMQRLQQRLRRRRRLRDPLLLLLRILAVLLTILAVTRPEVRWPGEPEDKGQAAAVVIVLDDSLSMDQRIEGEGLNPADRHTLFTQARAQAVELVKNLPDGVLVGAVTVGGEANRLTAALTPDRGAVAAALAEVRQGYGDTDLGAALGQARRLLAGKGGEVIVFTDEAGPNAVPGAAEEIRLLTAQGGAMRPRPILAEDAANVAVTSARYGDGPEGGTVRMELINYGRAPVETRCTVRLPGGTEINTFVALPAEGTAEATITVPRVSEGGVGRVEIVDDSLALDNTYAFHLPRIGASRVLVVDGDPGLTPTDSEVYFLERALAPWGQLAVSRGGVLPDVTASAGITSLDPEVHRVVFLANLADPASIAGRVIDFVRRGGGVVIGAGDNVTADRYNAAFSELLPAPLRRPRAIATVGEPGVPVALPDTALDLFQPFSRGGLAAFSKVRWHQVFTLDPYTDSGDVRTLMSLEGGIPLLVERRVGKGRAILLTGTFDLGWGNLPLQAVYMPLVQRLVGYLGGETGGSGERLQGTVGEVVSVPLPDSAVEVNVLGPTGPVASRVSGGALTFTPREIGAFSVQTPGAPPLAWVAVNTDPVESDVRRTTSLIETAAEVAPEQFLHRLSLSSYLLLGALALGLLQAAAALRKQRQEEQEDAAEKAA